MGNSSSSIELVERFAILAQQFCSIVDAAPSLDRKEFLGRIYPILPKLIDQAIAMPDLEDSDEAEQIRPDADFPKSTRRTHQEWNQLFSLVKGKLEDWDLYRQVFDPTQDENAIFGSLADDIADIYFDLKEGVASDQSGNVRANEMIFEWRFSFDHHWGKHAIDALLTIHFHLRNSS